MAVADELKIVLRAETARAVRALRNAQRQTDKSEQAFGKLIRTVGKSAAGWAAAALSIRAVVVTLRESVRLAGVQEQAERGLEAALIATGEAGGDAAESIKQYAAELQQATTFGDEATIAAAALFQQVSGLSSEMTRRALPVLQDFASAMGMDLQQAASLVGRSIGSTTNALTRYGVQIDNSLRGSRRFEAIVSQLDDRFGGFAQAVADTASGSLTQFQNTIGDTKEILGQFVLNSIEPAVQALNEFFTTINDGVSAQNELDSLLGGDNTVSDLQRINEELERQRAILAEQGGPDTISAMGLEAKFAVERLESEKRILEAARLRQQVFANLAEQEERGNRAQREARQENVAYLNRLQSIENEYQSTVRQTNILRNEGLIDAETANERIANAAEQAATKLAGIEFTQGLTENTRAAGAATMRAFIAEALRLAGSGGEEVGEKFAAGFDAFIARDAARLMGQRYQAMADAMVGETEDAAEAVTVTWQQAFNTIGNEAMATFSAFDSMMSSFEQRRIDAIEREYEAREKSWERQLLRLEAEGASEAEIASAKLDIIQEENRAEAEKERKIADLQKRQARRQKAIDIANATMGTASAVVSALGAKPWTPANYALAATVGALGAAQIGMIAATPLPAYERGGSFVTNGPQAIMVGDGASRRERVTVEPLAGPYRSSGSGHITININGAIGGREEIAVWVDEGLRRARQRGLVA